MKAKKKTAKVNFASLCSVLIVILLVINFYARPFSFFELLNIFYWLPFLGVSCLGGIILAAVYFPLQHVMAARKENKRWDAPITALEERSRRTREAPKSENAVLYVDAIQSIMKEIETLSQQISPSAGKSRKKLAALQTQLRGEVGKHSPLAMTQKTALETQIEEILAASSQRVKDARAVIETRPLDAMPHVKNALSSFTAGGEIATTHHLGEMESKIQKQRKAAEEELGNVLAGALRQALAETQRGLEECEAKLTVDPGHVAEIITPILQTVFEAKTITNELRLGALRPLESEIEVLAEKSTDIKTRAMEIVRLRKFEALMKNNPSIAIPDLAQMLNLTEDQAWERVFDWVKKYKLLIDGNNVLFNSETLQDFIADLDHQFQSWGKSDKV